MQINVWKSICPGIFNNAYFTKVYPIDYKIKAVYALKLFCQEFGVTEKITSDCSKEQASKGTIFMKKFHSKALIITSLSLNFTTIIQLRVSSGK